MFSPLEMLSIPCNPDVDSDTIGATDVAGGGGGLTVPGMGTAGAGAGVVISDKRLRLVEQESPGVCDECVGV